MWPSNPVTSGQQGLCVAQTSHTQQTSLNCLLLRTMQDGFTAVQHTMLIISKASDATACLHSNSMLYVLHTMQKSTAKADLLLLGTQLLQDMRLLLQQA